MKIQIYGEQDADGFYIGQIDNGRTGFVPSNMVSEQVEVIPSPVVHTPPVKQLTPVTTPTPLSPRESVAEEKEIVKVC